jgi:hypothetical protein
MIGRRTLELLMRQYILLSKQQLTLDGPVNENFKLYFEPIDSSIFAIRDIAREPKYLVVGAPWNIILVGVSSIPIKVTANIPMPIRAVFNSEGRLQYRYELVDKKITSTFDII